MTGRRRFIDTNIAVYAYDSSAGDKQTTAQAIHFHERYQLRYWDALIVATAKLSGCVSIVSEDLNEGQDYDGVVVVNPFTFSTP